MPPITFAHRGARIEERENTIPAFAYALKRGARGLESDAWLSADGEVVLAHGAVSWRGLRRVQVGRSTAADLAVFEIPRLADLYDACGTDFELSIDAKSRDVARPLLDVATRYGAADRLWLCSPSVGLLRDLRGEGAPCRLVHSRRRQALSVPLERHASDLAAVGIDAINMHHTDWSKGLVALFHRFGVAAFAWDVQEVRYLRAALTMEIDAVYSDHVDRMVATVAEWSG
ncbi:MAG: glycerophosphodiester phosphodiesterase [Acidimicrobiia bacterium]